MHRNRVQERWQDYKSHFLAPATPTFTRAMEHGFYAGVGSVVSILGEASSQEEFLALVADLTQEVNWMVSQQQACEAGLQGLKFEGRKGNG